MKRILFIILGAFLFYLTLPHFNYIRAQVVTAPLEITEEDASPSTYPYKLKVTNGSLTDNGDGTASLATTGGGSYTASGTLLNLTGTAFSVKEGTLTTTKGCKYVTGTGIVCDQDYLTAEVDPKVGTLTNTKWCYTDGNQIICNQEAPAGSGDITSIGDVTSGAAFDGTQGTTLTFNNAGGDATIIYDGSTFTFSKFITGNLTGNVTGNTSGSAGSCTGIASGNALPALSNLASVAINTSLLSDTAATDDLGTEALYWRKLYLSSDISFEGATDDAYQTTLTAVDTTLSDKSINIPNASGTMAVSATAPMTVSALGDIGVTVAKDIVAGVGLSGGEDNVLPGADADTTLTFDATELSNLTYGDSSQASLTITSALSGATDPTLQFGNNMITLSHDLTVSGGDIVLGTSAIFSGGDTTSLNLIDAIDATTETTLETALDIGGEVTSTGMASTIIADSVAVTSWALTTPTITTSAAWNADPADTGAIRLSNADYIYSEASPAGTDISVLGVDATEIIQIGASGASGVTITPTVTITGDLTVNGDDIQLGATGVKITDDTDGAITFLGLSAGFDESLTFNFDDVENTVGVTSGSGVTKIDFGAMNLATTVNQSGEPHHFRATIIDPATAYGKDTQICIVPKLNAAITVTNLEVTCNADPTTEPTGDIKYADTFIGLANATVINDFDTTAGVRTDSTITSGAVATGKAIYIQFDTTPDATLTQMSFDLTWDYD